MLPRNKIHTNGGKIRQRVEPELPGDDRREPVVGLAHVHRVERDMDPHRWRKRQHASTNTSSRPTVASSKSSHSSTVSPLPWTRYRLDGLGDSGDRGTGTSSTSRGRACVSHDCADADRFSRQQCRERASMPRSWHSCRRDCPLLSQRSEQRLRLCPILDLPSLNTHRGLRATGARTSPGPGDGASLLCGGLASGLVEPAGETRRRSAAPGHHDKLGGGSPVVEVAAAGSGVCGRGRAHTRGCRSPAGGETDRVAVPAPHTAPPLLPSSNHSDVRCQQSCKVS